MDIGQLAQQAISLATSGHWEEALKVNQQILKIDSQEINALNRSAKAFFELGQIKKARATAEKVLKIDPYNKIAQKSLARWKGLKEAQNNHASGLPSTQLFLEEPGKTKIVKLINLGDKKFLAQVDSGDEVKFSCHQHRVSVCTPADKYLGRLPDDSAARLRRLISLGYEYQVFIKSVEKNDLRVFIREIKRPEKTTIPSFPAEKMDYVAFIPPETIRPKESLIASSDEDTDQEE